MKTRDAIYVLACTLVIVFAITYPARAETGTLRVKCDKESETCTVPVRDLEDLLQNNNDGWEAAEAYQARIAELEAQIKAPPRCGTLEVEKPKVKIPKGDTNS